MIGAEVTRSNPLRQSRENIDVNRKAVQGVENPFFIRNLNVRPGLTGVPCTGVVPFYMGRYFGFQKPGPASPVNPWRSRTIEAL